MSSKKDLVEAHAFNRRRLVTAFVSGAPGGREVEPVRYGRTLVGGLVLAALVVAGAAVAPLLKPSLPKDWMKNGMVVGKESGSRFVAYNNVLYPVINTTSARLILATSGTFNVNFVPNDKIAEQKSGATIGIAGAPDQLPSPTTLLSSGWTACTNTAGGINVRVAPRPAVTPSATGAFVASARGTTWVVTGQHRYAVPAGQVGRQALRALKLDSEQVFPVPGTWLDLVPPGQPLQPFPVTGQGTRVRSGAPGLTTVGTPVKVDGRPYVLGTKGLLPLSDFAYTVYRSSGPGAQLPEQRLQARNIPKVHNDNAAAHPYSPDWPQRDVSAVDTGGSPCLLLSTSPTAPATVRLATARGPAARASTSGVTRQVSSGRGALVQATSGGVIGSGTTFLVDATGTRYAVGTKGTVGAALTALGYQHVHPVPVPAPWMSLFGDGPALTQQAAGQPPSAAR